MSTFFLRRPVIDVTFETALKEFLAVLAYEKNYSPHTIEAYRRDLSRFVKFLKTIRCEWQNVSPKQVRDYLSHRFFSDIKGRTLQRELSGLRRFYQHHLANGHVKNNPLNGIRAPRTEKRLPETLTIEQVSRLLDMPPENPLETRDVAMAELMYSSGLRLSELVTLDLQAMDLSAGVVRVQGKGSKQRDLPVGNCACVALKHWLDVRADWADAEQAALFVGRGGKRLSTRAVQKRLSLLAGKRGLDLRLHPHLLRHSFASHILESSGDLRAVQELLGHTDISTTQVYTHLDFQHLAKVYDKAHPRARRR